MNWLQASNSRLWFALEGVRVEGRHAGSMAEVRDAINWRRNWREQARREAAAIIAEHVLRGRRETGGIR